MLSVAIIHGNAVGGGAELTTACDFRLMHPDARIGFVQVEVKNCLKKVLSHQRLELQITKPHYMI